MKYSSIALGFLLCGCISYRGKLTTIKDFENSENLRTDGFYYHYDATRASVSDILYFYPNGNVYYYSDGADIQMAFCIDTSNAKECCIKSIESSIQWRQKEGKRKMHWGAYTMKNGLIKIEYYGFDNSASILPIASGSVYKLEGILENDTTIILSSKYKKLEFQKSEFRLLNNDKITKNRSVGKSGAEGK